MALPVTVTNAALWSDHKNQNHGGAQRLTFYTDNTDNGTFYNLGDTSSHVGIIAGYSGQAGHKLLRFRCYLQRVGNPTGNVFIEIRDAISSTAMDLGVAPIGVSRSFPVSGIPTTGKNEYIFTFSVPATLPLSDSTSFGIVLTISAQGDSSNYVKVYRGICGDRGVYHSYEAGNQTWNAETGGSGLSLSKVIEISKSGARVLTIDKTNNEIELYKTDDNSGSIWSLDASNGFAGAANLESVNAQGSINDLGATYFARNTITTFLGIRKRTETGSTDEPALTANFSTLGTNVTGFAPIYHGRRVDGTSVIVAQGATETIMGTARRRIKLSFYNGTSWSSLFDVVGSANTPDATLPGDANHHDLRWAALDPNGDFHIVYSKSDTSTLQYRKFTSANAFTTINTMNGAVASATANYPVGLGAFLFKSPDWYVAIPYVDNSSSTLKEARCKTTDTATSGNWVITQIVAANAETSGSNPAVLIADNLQGGKVFCLRVKPTAKGLAFTHDSGNSTWVTEADWRGAMQTVGGISGLYTEDGVGFVYLEESTTPDEIRYDRL